MSPCMRSKLLLLLFIGLFCFCAVYFQFMSTSVPKSWRTLVLSETHKHIRNFKKLNERPQGDYFSDAVPYLNRLGYLTPEKSNTIKIEKKMPVLVVPGINGKGYDISELLVTVNTYLSNMSCIVYDLGLGYWEKSEVSDKCKLPLCKVVEFSYSDYPSHVKNTKLKAYRPLIVQEVLNSSGAVFWLSPDHRVTSPNIGPVLQLASSKGVAFWGLDEPTSAITHPKMFTFFRTDVNHYYFHRTVSGDRFILYNTEDVRKNLMFPWLQCALTAECIKPVGSQDSGCRTYRKPLYLYSGCHDYDSSILNVVLGLMFQFQAEKYICEHTFFVSQSEKSKLQRSLHDSSKPLSGTSV